ncbi:hypothetical protein RRG08_001438 [Elysia crispata]|uniref:EGF-like domain-containing protein n=1 Tax=Elysia crispata TaxID=231223 RepID=A0AAE0ZQG6_9GAST|nr:hypothetical protein RRG08_001438 [Elysia crispata]
MQLFPVCHCTIILVLFGFFLISSSIVHGKKVKGQCSTCKDISKNFYKALESTAKSNYGGGNTGWEEKSLGSYATSEVRLVEVIEKLCDDSSKECHSLLEEHEEVVERFWFKEFAQKKDTDFYAYVCIDHLMLCCPNNTFGKDCAPCPGGVDRPCNGNGGCDGAGTRVGTGKCRCNSGYQGDLCLECKDGFYEESSNETHTICKVCHISCKNICSEGGPKGCDECKDGWLDNEELGCQDIDECATEPCEENQYCSNTQGSYTCFSCDVACESCTGPGSKKCKECHSGFTLTEDSSECIDDNECDTDTSLCNGENEICKNTPGSYECACQTGFVRRDDACVPSPKDADAGETDSEEEKDVGDVNDVDADKDDEHEENETFSESNVKEEL